MKPVSRLRERVPARAGEGVVEQRHWSITQFRSVVAVCGFATHAARLILSACVAKPHTLRNSYTFQLTPPRLTPTPLPHAGEG